MLRYRTRQLIRAVFTSFWFWPLTLIAFAFWLATTIAVFTENLPASATSQAAALLRGADAYAAAILTTTAAANVTVLTFAFSTLMIVLQLASSQLSPRLLRTMVREGSAQTSMAVMAGGFVFSLYSLLLIYETQDDLAPLLLAVAGLVWTIVVLLTFLRFVGYTISHIRAPAVIRSVAKTTAESIGRIYPRADAPTDPIVPAYETSAAIEAPRDGVITEMDMSRIARWAEHNDATVTLTAGLGEYVSTGIPIGAVASSRPVRASSVNHFIVFERERTLRGDPPYGFRLLVDIANRALSPAINDPTTAVQVLDELQSLLVVLARRPEQPGRFYDRRGVLRLDASVVRWTTYLNAAVQEIYEYGSASSQVTQRIGRMLDDLAAVVTGDRLRAVEELKARITVIPPLVTSGRHPVSAATEG